MCFETGGLWCFAGCWLRRVCYPPGGLRRMLAATGLLSPQVVEPVTTRACSLRRYRFRLGGVRLPGWLAAYLSKIHVLLLWISCSRVSSVVMVHPAVRLCVAGVNVSSPCAFPPCLLLLLLCVIVISFLPFFLFIFLSSVSSSFFPSPPVRVRPKEVGR